MLSKIRVQNFRKHADLTLDFKAGATVITGQNGSGKSSLLEAVYVALQGKSWRSNFSEILRDDGQKNADWWRIDLEFSDNEKRTVKFINSVKSFEIDGKTSARLPVKSKKPVILFEPNDLQLLYGSPNRRRDFIDRFIAQIEPIHASNLRKFERVLRQRNNLLKQGATLNELFVWDLQFADLSEKIIIMRDKWIKEIDKNLTDEYRKIATSDDLINVKYIASQKSRQQILDQLNSDFSNSWLYTKTGPQSHDVKFKINNHDAKLAASRGENRTIIFACLATMVRIMNQTLGDKVYLLFDDIDSELDDGRREALYRNDIFNNNYLLATTIKLSDDFTANIDIDEN